MVLLDADNTEKSNLAYHLTLSLMDGAVQACIDADGHANAFKALAPCIKLNADWCLSNSEMFIGRLPNGIEGLLEMMNWAMNMANRGKAKYHSTSEGTIIIELKNCRTNGGFPTMCQWWCQREFSTMCEDSNPELKMCLDKSLLRGDDVCQWTIDRKDGKRLSLGDSKPRDFTHKCRTKETLDFWAQAGPAEFMTLSTACLVERVGKEKALKLLTRRAREKGVEFGAYFLQSSNKSERTNHFSALELFNSLMNVETTTSKIDDDSWEVEIGSCPFSGVPPEVCAQIEELKRGALGVVLHDQEWTYDESCSKDGICRQKLMLNKKTEKEREGVKTQSGQKEIKSILKLRLAKGEITLVDYDLLLEKLTTD